MRSPLRRRVLYALCTVIGSTSLHASGVAILGYWREPSGSIIQIAPCGAALCMKIVALPPGPHPSTDVHNPNRALRKRPLCGLRIGEGMVERDSRHADGGRLYDPKSGRTYRGSMTADGDRLELRGYIGLKLFGRTETWTRVERVALPSGRCI